MLFTPPLPPPPHAPRTLIAAKATDLNKHAFFDTD